MILDDGMNGIIAFIQLNDNSSIQINTFPNDPYPGYVREQDIIDALERHLNEELSHGIHI